jgi:N-acetylneuraminic acid mutarotase
MVTNDSIKINTNTNSIKKLKAHLRIARMNHSMVYIDELEAVLAVGGVNDTGSLLDSCELLVFKNKKWKIIGSLNYKGKNLSLCKFVKDY